MIIAEYERICELRLTIIAGIERFIDDIRVHHRRALLMFANVVVDNRRHWITVKVEEVGLGEIWLLLRCRLASWLRCDRRNHDGR